MKLLNNLFTIVENKVVENNHNYTIKLDSEHFIYKAHFPGEPITPGVCIMQIAQELLEHATDTRLYINCVKNVKFLRIISPNEITIISFVLSKVAREDDIIKAQISVISENDTFAKLSLVCQVID
jgi:3-hydroxyacyl-[acyl-carrier-protein] dehydratase